MWNEREKASEVLNKVLVVIEDNHLWSELHPPPTWADVQSEPLKTPAHCSYISLSISLTLTPCMLRIMGYKPLSCLWTVSYQVAVTVCGGDDRSELISLCLFNWGDWEEPQRICISLLFTYKWRDRGWGSDWIWLHCNKNTLRFERFRSPDSLSVKDFKIPIFPFLCQKPEMSTMFVPL